MKVSRMIAELQKYSKDAEVKIGGFEGDNAVFILVQRDLPEVVAIETKADVDMSEELNARFEYAAEHQVDELDFFIDLTETGITLEDIKEFAPGRYEYANNFMKSHGLV